jgi:FtsP/CotA-like multicopper oxidase with cupredoxin domain
MRGGTPHYEVGVGPIPNHNAGLISTVGGETGPAVPTPVWGYGQGGAYTWPGKTFEVQSGQPTQVQWQNNLSGITQHLLPVDTSLHWCYALHGYEDRTIAADGVPIVVHLHGGHTEDLFDGNPEQFFTPNWRVRGPQFRSRTAMYRNDRPAGNLWYHDHALGITRLNVYAGLAGFYFLRDDEDTGTPDNTLNLPAWPYEKAYAIQDRMFLANGELFYPAFKGDPYYWGFITDGEAILPPADFHTDGGPTALAEFFGDHMVVNGVIWPFEEVEPRNYRMHLLNGTDSRFMAIRFRDVGPAAGMPTEIPGAAPYVPFDVIGSDQGLASDITTIATENGFLLSEPGSRYDIIVDFKEVPFGNRVIMENIGGDEPFGGDVPGPQVFEFTNRIMAFDVVLDPNELVFPDTRTDVSPTSSDINFGPDVTGTVTRTRKVALFEGMDEFGRLQPLLGTAEPATDFKGRPINWPDEDVYSDNSLTGQMEGSIGWHSPTTENPDLNSTEEWEIWNVTGDAHPVHLHLVHFEVLQTVIGNGEIGRQEINFDSAADEDGFLNGATPNDDGAYVVPQAVVQHNDEVGQGFRIVFPTDPAEAYGDPVLSPPGYVEDAPKDMVTALPGQITRIKATFDKPGRYVWHCHILSHEDHEMMRVLHVGGGA